MFFYSLYTAFKGRNLPVILSMPFELEALRVVRFCGGFCQVLEESCSDYDLTEPVPPSRLMIAKTNEL